MILFPASRGAVKPKDTRANARTCFIGIVDSTSARNRRAIPQRRASTDPDFARELAVVFEERLLPLQVFGGGLHVTLFVGHTRHDGMFPMRGALPGVGEQLPRVLGVCPFAGGL